MSLSNELHGGGAQRTDLLLSPPSLKYEGQINDFRRECLLFDHGQMNGVGGLADLSVPEWLLLLEQKKRPETCPEGLVPDSTFLCVRQSDDRLVGMINIRHQLNDYLLNYGGHIGYSIRPDERGKGYGGEQLHLALLFCRELGLPRVLLTCEPKNEASKRVIVSQGGVLEDEQTHPEGKRFLRYWITL